MLLDLLDEIGTRRGRTRPRIRRLGGAIAAALAALDGCRLIGTPGSLCFDPERLILRQILERQEESSGSRLTFQNFAESGTSRRGGLTARMTSPRSHPKPNVALRRSSPGAGRSRGHFSSHRAICENEIPLAAPQSRDARCREKSCTRRLRRGDAPCRPPLGGCPERMALGIRRSTMTRFARSLATPLDMPRRRALARSPSSVDIVE